MRACMYVLSACMCRILDTTQTRRESRYVGVCLFVTVRVPVCVCVCVCVCARAGVFVHMSMCTHATCTYASTRLPFLFVYSIDVYFIDIFAEIIT